MGSGFCSLTALGWLTGQQLAPHMTGMRHGLRFFPLLCVGEVRERITLKSGLNKDTPGLVGSMSDRFELGILPRITIGDSQSRPSGSRSRASGLVAGRVGSRE